MGKRRPTLGLDLDGVIVDFNQMWMREWHREFGERHYVEDVTDWEYRKGALDMSSNDFWRWVEKVKLWHPERTIPYPDNLAVAQKMHRRYDIHVITSKPTWAIPYTAEWLADRSGISFKALTFTRNKASVLCDAYVDDSPKNLAALASGPHPPYAPQALVYRHNRPWNFPLPGTLTIDSLEELM